MRFARWVFAIAGVYGVLVTLPLFFQESQVSRTYPPPVTHPEYYYGFVCVTLAWQLAFLVISRDPVRYRLMMLPAMFEKFSYALAMWVLFAQARVGTFVVTFATIDLILGISFVLAFVATRPKAVEKPALV